MINRDGAAGAMAAMQQAAHSPAGSGGIYKAVRQGGPHSHDDGSPGEHDHPHEHPDLDEIVDDHADHLNDHAGRLDDHDGRLAALEGARPPAQT
jgi:hypothetical protein